MEKVNTFELMSFVYALSEAAENYSINNSIVRDGNTSIVMADLIEYMTEKRCCDNLINQEFEALSCDAIGLMIDLFDSLKFTDIEKIERAYKKALDLYFKEAAEV